jgi:hypothetical protein
LERANAATSEINNLETQLDVSAFIIVFVFDNRTSDFRMLKNYFK